MESYFGIADEREDFVTTYIAGRLRQHLAEVSNEQKYKKLARRHRREGEFDVATSYDELAYNYGNFATENLEAYLHNFDLFVKDAPRAIRDEVRKNVKQRLARIKPPKVT